MKEFEIDFTEEINAQASEGADSLDKLTYKKTPEVFLKVAEKDFKYMDINIKPLLELYPPANSSQQTKNELLQVKNFMERSHSKEFTSNLKSMNDEPAMFIIDYYKKASGKEVPKTILGFITGGDVEVLAMKLKMHFNRPRPFQMAEYYDVNLNYNKTIQHGAADAPSYPSGHTLSAYFAARVLSYLYPKYEDELLRRAMMVADSRIAEGVHFKSDNMFSFYLVDRVLMPAFIKAYDKTRNN
tara:strand:- start:985 stop:1710 length:726 start_codon:yes stop_codon:yes gene_type:complete